MAKLVVARRETDIVLSILKNDNGRFIIVDANDEFIKHFYYSRDDIKGKYLRDFLSGDAAEALGEIESGDSVFDICDMLPRVAGFTFLTSSNLGKLVKVKVFRSFSDEDLKERYEIVMRNFSVSERFIMYKKRASLSMLDDGDPLGMMMPVATKTEIDLILQFVRSERDCEVIIGCICPDVKHEFVPIYRYLISQALAGTLRSGDRFGCLENGVVIFFLMGCNISAAEKVMARVYGKVNSRLVKEKSVTVSISYGAASSFHGPDDALSTLLDAIGKARDNHGNQILAC